ncbi:hypothetical protein HAX54_005999 [Datura stramonium]|uniref:Uncharacterized protein n=1 Tax=Datura stramonium TaxID=4076 RepID=A0ABS8RHV2_DATST|nr:hypothetical protein [Datura stramonium]
MAGDCRQKNAAVEGHHSQHNQISQSDSDSVQSRLDQPRRHVINTLFDVISVREPLDEEGECKNDEKCEDIHTDVVVSRPTGEENFGVFSPEKRHVHHHHVVAVRGG